MIRAEIDAQGNRKKLKKYNKMASCYFEINKTDFFPARLNKKIKKTSY